MFSLKLWIILAGATLVKSSSSHFKRAFPQHRYVTSLSAGLTALKWEEVHNHCWLYTKANQSQTKLGCALCPLLEKP